MTAEIGANWTPQKDFFLRFLLGVILETFQMFLLILTYFFVSANNPFVKDNISILQDDI
jgi:hypothetical protein